MRIIIAGATGYLGNKLAEKFCVPGEGDRNALLLLARNKNKLSETLKKKDNVQICEIYTDQLKEEIEAFNPDMAYCTTCCYETDPEYLYKTIDAHYVFPSQLLKILSCLGKPIRLISAGTSLPPLLNLYSLTKKHFADLGAFFHQNKKIEFVNMMLESFYGIDEPRNRFITRSILQLKANQALLLTEGLQKRDFIFIDDVVEIMVFLASCKMPETGCGIPVGTGTAPSIREIVTFLRQETHSQSDLRFGSVKMRNNEPSTVADLSILRGLGYAKPIMPWQEGMKKVIGALK
jgi:CDP-paratose synthetase